MCVYVCMSTYVHIYTLYLPRTCNHELPLSFGQGSRAALEGVSREHRGSRRSTNRAAREQPVPGPCPPAIVT